jgi:flagellar motor switch/type III secretory pathway protein FliN
MTQAEEHLALKDSEGLAQQMHASSHLRGVPLRLAVTIPVPRLKLRDVRSLRAGRLVLTEISAAEDVPVTVGGALLGWAELDSIDGRMAIRLTSLS